MRRKVVATMLDLDHVLSVDGITTMVDDQPQDMSMSVD
jgi:hypothetical protein